MRTVYLDLQHLCLLDNTTNIIKFKGVPVSLNCQHAVDDYYFPILRMEVVTMGLTQQCHATTLSVIVLSSKSA